MSSAKACLSHGLADDVFARPTWADFQAGVYECIGTTLFLFFGLMGCQNYPSMTAMPQVGDFVCASSMGLSLFSIIGTFFNVTGAVFNPAIALALFAVGCIRFWRFVFFVVAQLIGAVIATALLKGLYPGELSVRTQISAGLGLTRAVFLEAFTTGALVLIVLKVAVNKRNAWRKASAPFFIAAVMFVGHLTTLTHTGTSMNPARSFGPAVLDGGFSSDHWVFWVGPILGSIVATGLYKYMHYSKYWSIGACDHPILPQFFADRHSSLTTRELVQILHDRLYQVTKGTTTDELLPDVATDRLVEILQCRLPGMTVMQQLQILPSLPTTTLYAAATSTTQLLTPASNARTLANDEENCLALHRGKEHYRDSVGSA